MKKRNLYTEIAEGFDAMSNARARGQHAAHARGGAQARAKPKAQAALLIRLVEKFPTRSSGWRQCDPSLIAGFSRPEHARFNGQGQPASLRASAIPLFPTGSRSLRHPPTSHALMPTIRFA